MTRPWRLTRRERVAMEAALAGIRDDVAPRTGCHSRGAYRAARLFCDAHALERWDLASDERSTESWRLIPLRDWRILRARVAIALRAALRADEDARCEEVLARVHRMYDAADFERSELRAGAEDSCDALREWPAVVSQTRDTGARISLLEWSQSLGGFVPDLDTLDAETREGWTSRRLPVMATAYALWERPKPP